MIEEGKFWLRIWQSLILGFVLITATIGGCVAYANHNIDRMVESGISPHSAKCAIWGCNNGTYTIHRQYKTRRGSQ